MNEKKEQDRQDFEAIKNHDQMTNQILNLNFLGITERYQYVCFFLF